MAYQNLFRGYGSILGGGLGDGTLTGREGRQYLDMRRDAALDAQIPLTGRIRTSQPTERAVDTQLSLGTNLEQMFQTFGQNQRDRINRDFDDTLANAMGSLQERGFGGSTGLLTDATAVQESRQLALGDLEQGILGQRINSATGIANTISGLLDSSSQQGVDIISSLLGMPAAQRSSSSGGGGGGGGVSRAPDNSEPWDPFKYIGGNPGGGGSGGGGSGGGGSGGGGGGVPIENPAFDEPASGSGDPWEGKDPNEVMYFRASDGRLFPLTRANYMMIPEAHRPEPSSGDPNQDLPPISVPGVGGGGPGQIGAPMPPGGFSPVGGGGGPLV